MTLVHDPEMSGTQVSAEVRLPSHISAFGESSMDGRLDEDQYVPEGLFVSATEPPGVHVFLLSLAVSAIMIR